MDISIGICIGIDIDIGIGIYIGIYIGIGIGIYIGRLRARNGLRSLTVVKKKVSANSTETTCSSAVLRADSESEIHFSI
jgi:hypothetical protein